MSRFYVTTPIYYVNAVPHLGHAYTTTAADVLRRWNELAGREAFLLTGTDEHGQKVLQAAEARGMSPQAHVDELSEPFRALLPPLQIEASDFIRTTEPRHTSVVQDVLEHLRQTGDLYTADYEGWYSTAAERFWTEKDLVDGKCPDTGQPVEWIKEKNWFFRMSKYADQLRQWIEDHPGFLRPETRRNEVLGYLRKEVGDLCISRPKSRMSWGIEIPFDREYVVYVWFDALLNYITARGYHPDPAKRSPDFDAAWPADLHLVGKDILTTHAVYWSTMLFALGLQPADCLFAHGWWTIEGRKMSKSLGNVVDPHLLIEAYGPDAVRYFLMAEIAFGNDGDFSHNSFLLKYNADLANDLGNLAHRSLTMTKKWLGSVVPELDEPSAGDLALEALAAETLEAVTAAYEAYQPSEALGALFRLVGAGNKYIDTEEPWRLNREGQAERLGGVMRRCLEICRIAAVLISPVCPGKAEELAAKLGMDQLSLEGCGGLSGLTAGTPVRPGKPLFPRLQEIPAVVQGVLDTALAEADAAAAQAAPKKPKKKKKKSKAPPAPIGIEDFAKVELKAGRILGAEKHPEADRLLVLSVDVGEAAPRTIVAGIASLHDPTELPGRTVVVVTNLRPATLRGVESQGMVLAAGGKQVLGLLGIEADVPPGTVVR